MSSIFLSYRRADSLKDAGRLDDRLWVHFGRENVFKDFYSIELGDPFQKIINDYIQRTDVMLVIIGKQWATIKNDTGIPRLFDEKDLVRHEVVCGLERMKENKIVIPVLVDNATMPDAKLIPEVLHPLLGLNAHIIKDDPDFHSSVDQLIEKLSKRGVKSTNHLSTQVIRLFDVDDAIDEYFRLLKEANQHTNDERHFLDSARTQLALIRSRAGDTPQPGFSATHHENRLWERIKVLERDRAYMNLKRTAEYSPDLLEGSLKNFWQTYPKYDPDELASRLQGMPVLSQPSDEIQIQAWYEEAINSQDFETSVNLLSKVIDHRKDYIDAYYERGNRYLSINQFNEAIADFAVVLSAYPKHADTWFFHGLAYHWANNFDQAISSYQKVLQFKVGDRRALNALKKAKNRLPPE